MTKRAPHKPPEHVGLLPDGEAIKHLTAAVLQGVEDLPQDALAAATERLEDEARWRADPIRELVDEAIDRFESTPTRADAWLAPRLHAALRITRREASNSCLW